VEEYRNGHAYAAGDQVSHHGELYTCKQPGWCGQGPYEPGKPWNGQEIWRDAWTHDGKCDSGEQGNTLTLEFSPQPTYVPKQQRLRQPKPLSGLLRCGAEETPFSADWGERLPLKGLKACRYQLILNAATSGHMPFRAPRLIEFKNESGEAQTEEIDYVRPVNLDQLKPLPGVKVEVFAQGLLEPRQMALGKGVVYVGSSALPYGAQPDVGNFIYALPLDGSGKVRGIHVIASGLEEPHGVAYRNGDLYYSTSDGIYRMRGIDNAYANPPAAEKVRSFPSDEDRFPIPGQGWPDMNWRRWHMKHPIMFNPVNPGDPWLYSMVGRVCNTCIMQPDPRYGTLIRYNVDTGAEQVIAYGVRNSVGWDWDPRTGDIWWSDNNRQRMYNGDEMNRLIKPGEGPAPHFGSPYMYAYDLGFTPEEWATPGGRLEAMGYAGPVNGVVLSDKSLDQIDPNQYEAPSFVMGSGTAPLGVKFWNGYRPQAGMQRLLFATHSLGSNPREAGLEVDMLIIDSQSKVVAETPLITGWQKNYGEGGTNCKDGCSGRPVEFLAMPDGSLLVSDDIQGVIYRVTYDASGLPGTSLKLRAPPAPDESIAKQMVTGSLTDIAGGVVRKFAIAWGSDALEFPGLPAGQYSLRLEDVGDWVPATRVTPISLSGNFVFDFTYEPRQNGTGTITVNAPPKPNPRLITESLDVQVVGVGGDGMVRRVTVPWGGSGSLTVPYGTYIVRSPFVSPSFRPEPSIAMVDVEQGSNPAPVVMQYEYVESLGHAIITKTCNGCHSYAFFDDPKKADRWERDGVEALIATIKGMNVAGHCDDVCAGETAEYLYNVVWHPYLKPEADSSTRQVRLLTRDEYRNSVQDVLGVLLNSELIPDDTIDLEFRYPGLADLGVINNANMGLYYELAVRVARQVDVQQLGFQQGGDNKAFVESLGRRLYRSRLTAAQSADMVAYLQEHGPNNLVAAMLVSPYFLYRSELGDNSEGGLFRLTQSEIATLLSFGFLGTTPSVDLMDKAEAGLLDTPDAIRAEVESMLSTERGQEQFARFVRYYDRSYKVVGDKPGLDDLTIADMRRELDTFSKQLIAKPSATMTELFNPGYTFLNERLARHYGINGVSGEAMQRVSVDRTRGGLLHMGIMHVSNSDNTATSLVKRGKMLREQMFCKTVGAGTGLDPEDVTFPTEPYTTRTYWTLITGEHASSGQCWGCHVYMNYGGASFENYAADGRYRIVEKAYNNASVDVPIDASGVLADNTGLGTWMSFNDARDISQHVPENADARDCLARSYYGYVLGEQPTAGGRQTVKDMSQDLAAGGLLHKMLARLATSDALLYRKEGD
jgi:glucose/arabinose dehydrogenase